MLFLDSLLLFVAHQCRIAEEIARYLQKSHKYLENNNFCHLAPQQIVCF